MSWFDAVGMVGVVAILAAYALLQAGRLRAEDPRHPALNGIGALLVLVSLVHDFNLSAAVVEGAWLLISAYGLARSLRRAPNA